MGALHELDAEECRLLLGLGVAGRVAVVAPDGPHVVPVNYALTDSSLVFRTTPYSLLGTYGRDAMLAFEVDHVDHEYQQGWSVVVRGHGRAVEDPVAIRRILQGSDPRPWAQGTRSLLIELPLTAVTGRRVGPSLGLERDHPLGSGRTVRP